MSMVLATTWVRRGVAAPFPQKYEVDEAELGRISKLARLQLEDAQDDLCRMQPKSGAADEEEEVSDDSEEKQDVGGVRLSGDRDAEDEDLKEYNLEDYDNEPIDDEGEKFSMFGNVRSLAYHARNEEDPYLDLPEGDGDGEDEEREELQILATDNLLLAAKVEDEVAHLEVMIYEDEADNLYVHHDIMLPAVPLCVEWIDLPVGKDTEGRASGNFVAVSTMRPEIEIWDLDVVDSMYPNTILGQEPDDTRELNGATNGATKGKKKRKKAKPNEQYHVDAVLWLAANRQHRNLLASASADQTVKLWDLSSGNCAKSYSMHQGKVCSLDWHPTQSTLLLSGGYDRAVIATDMRAPDAKAPRWTVEADIEQVRWNSHDGNYFYATTEAGTVHYFDCRNSRSGEGVSKPLWTLQAHDGAVSTLDINPTIPGFLATGSDDRQVKLWNVKDNKPSMVISRNPGVGRVFSARFAPDSEVSFRLAVAGSKGAVQVWDTSTNSAVRRNFAGRIAMPDGEVKERFVGIAEDSGESDDGEEDNGAEIGQARAEGWESMDED
jgi:periodic tryptophan protein 1